MPQRLTKMAVETLAPKPKPYEVRDDKLVGFTVRISRGGTRTFWLRYPFGGKRSNRHRIGTYPNVSVDEARALAKAAAGDVARGINPAERKKAEKIKSENDRLLILRTYLDERFEPYAMSEMKSGAEQLRRLRSDFADRLDKPMTTLSDFWADGLRRRWLDDGLTNKTINRDFQRIEAVLAHAVKWGVLKEHPLAKIEPLDEDEGGRVRFLSAAEEKALREALIKRDDKMRADRDSFNAKVAQNRKLPPLDGEFVDHLRPIVIFAINTGMRRGEIFSLTWANVDLQAETIEVKAATSKSGQTRRLPANAEAIKILTAWRNHTGASDGYVFPGVPGKKNKTKHGWRLTNVTRAWNGLVKQAALVDFNFHDLRHHFASRMVQKGVDLNTVRVLLGHKDIKTTLIYAHLAPDNLRAAVAHLAVAS